MGTLLGIICSSNSCPTCGSILILHISVLLESGYGALFFAPGSFTPRFFVVIRAERDKEGPGSGSLGTAG